MKEKIRDYHNYNFQTSKNKEKDLDLINENDFNKNLIDVYDELIYKLDERYNLNQNNKKILSKNDLIFDTYQKLKYNNKNKIINKSYNIDLNNFYNIYIDVIDNYYSYINLNNYKSDDLYKILSDFELLMMDYNNHLKQIIKKEEEQDEDEDDILKLNIFNYVLYKHFNIEKKFIYSTFSNNDIKTNYILSNMPISEISNILEKYKNEIDTKDEMKIYNKLKEYVDYNKKK
jgi:hypothetical protein